MSKVELKSSHIYLGNELVESVFNNINYAYVTYLEKQSRILITPVSSQWFVKMYEPKQFLLKSRNLNGDKTIAIREILLDNDLDMTNRSLNFEVIEKLL